jgi:D-alanyl-D-alanine dipeptidase
MDYKIINRFNIKVICTLVFFTINEKSIAQDTSLNKYGLQVINNVSTYTMKLLRLKQIIPGVWIDLRYATKNKFLQEKIYSKWADAYLCKPATVALSAVQKTLSIKGLGLKIFDAYRPYAITEKMWEAVKDDRYAADPKYGSGHNRGVAVDLTIISLKTKKELNMGTGFDNFTDSAHHNFTKFSKEILDNRLLLKTTMEQFGFKALDTEWWHYSLPDAKNYPLMDIDFDLLAKKK